MRYEDDEECLKSKLPEQEVESIAVPLVEEEDRRRKLW